MMTPSPDRDKKAWIRPLPERVVNKIAAGEVVERPAAVVKELVENSLDAGATRIDIVIEKAGIKLIKIADDGCGIPEEQIEVAFGRHATSKISAFDDLNALHSYGFRGEALPSIASVSRLRMVSRVGGEPSGTELIIEGGVVQSKKPIAAPPGTTVEVANLFYNTPARRKFLRAESTESRYLSRTATALAISSPGVGFTYTANGRRVFSVPPGQNLSKRTLSLLGEKGKFFDLDQEIGPVRIVGCLGLPETAQHNRYGQYLFINDRYIFSTVLSHAVRVGFGEMIPGGSFPIGTLCLTVDPAEIDVNVHPSKTEVRLSQEREIHTAIRHAVRDALRHDSTIPALGTVSGPPRGRSVQTVIPSPSREGHSVPNGGSGPGHGRENVIPGIAAPTPANTEFLAELYRQTPNIEPSDIVRVDRQTGEILTDQERATSEAAGPSSGFRLVGRFSDLYLLLQAGEDLYIVDQHTAHERVLYEEMKTRIEASSVDGQNLLFPVQIELSPEQLAVFEESRELLTDSGFAISGFG